MPGSSPKTVPERNKGTLDNTHPRKNGDVIPTPDDIMEGRGNFVNRDADGNPEGMRIGRVELPDGWDALIGESSTGITQQNGGALPITRPSFVSDQPIVVGPPAPSPNDPLLAKIPQPQTPLLKVIKTDMAGLPGTTPDKPLWYQYAWAKAGLLTTPSPPVPFQVAQGQGVRVSWPDPPAGVDGVSLFISEPGTSTATSPGVMREQRFNWLALYKLKTYDITTFRAGRIAPWRNETQVVPPSQPARLGFINTTVAAKIGVYTALVTFVDSQGNETLPSSVSPPVNVVGCSRFYDEQGVLIAGCGYLEVFRPPYMPVGASGWFAYLVRNGTSYRVVSKPYWGSFGLGDTRPFPNSWTKVQPAGWSQEDSGLQGVYASHDSYMLVQHALPTKNETGIDPPTAAPDIPVAFGASRPGPGRKYVQVVERVGNRRSSASDVVSKDLAFDEILRVVHRDHTNLFANGDNIELDASGLPLDHTVVTTGGTARVEGRELVLETLSAQTGTTPSDTLDPVSVDRTITHAVWGYIKVREPRSGTLQGSVDVVLRELNASGAITDTTLFSYTQAGEYEYHRTINPAGGGGVAWRSDTAQAGVVIRFSGATKNLHVRSTRVVLKDHPHKWRYEGEPPESELSRPPGTQTAIGTSPTVAPPPETYPWPEPDRPKLVGTVRESVDFEPGMPAGWAQNTSGGATLVRSAAAALSGSWGLRIQDTTTGSVSAGYLSKVFDPDGTPEMGFSRKIRPALLPSGKLILGGLARPADGELFAWLESGSLSEISTLTIDSSPTAAGNFTVAPDGASAGVSVVATKQVEQLNIATAPTTFGTVSFTLGGVKYNVQAGGTPEKWEIWNFQPRYVGYVQIIFDGVPHYIPAYGTADQYWSLGKRIAETSFPGWRLVNWIPQQGSWSPSPAAAYVILIYEATTPGPKGSSFSYWGGTSGTPGGIGQLQAGTLETAIQFADRIAGMSFPGWTVSHTPGTTAITFTAIEAGAKPPPTINWGATGGSGTFATTTPGATDTPADLAARIRATAFTGWTISGSGAQVVLTANSAGFKRDLRIDPGPTGVRYHFETTQQGKDADLTAHYKDDSGTVYSRRVMANLSSSAFYVPELTVQGAGTDKAMLTVWGAAGSAAKDHLWRVEDVSLINYPAGMVHAGVTSEAAASETWDIHLDDIKVTDRGETYFDETDMDGKRVGQFHYYGLPTQPLRQDIGIQEWFEPCVPGTQYAIAAYLRTDNVPAATPAKPVFITAYKDDGSVIEIGDVTGDGGISGTHDWYEPTPRLVIAPEKCYQLGFASRDMSSGEIVVQKVVMSEGAVPKRTGRYATSGSYTATLQVGTPYQPLNTLWGHMRRLLETVTDAPAGSSVEVLYRSAQTQSDLVSAIWQSDPLLVPNFSILQGKVVFTSDGIAIPVLMSGSPRVLYDVILEGSALSTLLREDRSELDGGAIFGDTLPYARDPEAAMSVLPGLRLRPQILSDDAPTLPESSLYVFTLDAYRELLKNWYKPWVVETDGEALTVRLAARPVPTEIGESYILNGKQYGTWSFALSWGEILGSEPLL